MPSLKVVWHNLKAYDNLVGIGEIARRYFAMNAFDGVLTMIGVFMGNLAAGVDKPVIVLTTGLTTSIAMGVSGLWGAYLTETAERQRELDDLSHYTLTDLNNSRIGQASRVAVTTSIAMGVSGLWGAYLTETAERQRELDDLSHYTLTDLNNSRIGQASRVAVIIVAVVDGLSPLLAALMVLSPFMVVQLWPANAWPISWVYYTALGLALLTLFGLGMFLGRISRQNLWLFGLKTVMAGVLSILISYLLRGVEY